MNALSRKKDYRNSVVRNLATSLILHEKIKTTRAKAKTVKPVVEHLISIAKKNDLAAKRKLLGYLFDEKATDKTFEVLVPRYKKLNSGFIRSFNLGTRLGDNAEITLLQLVPGEKEIGIPEEKAAPKKEIEKEVKGNTNASKEESTGKVKAEKPAQSKPRASKAGTKTK